jgi:NhaP-type Na+/H+ or K+/H+ antiporter
VGSTLRLLLFERESLMDDLADCRRLGRHVVSLLALMVLGAGVYGAVLGMWHGSRLSLYVALKLPLVLLLTSALTLLFNSLVATLMGLSLRFSQVAVLTLLALAVAAVLLGSLAPVAWFFSESLPDPSVRARTTHNLLYLFHTGFVGVSGLVGCSVLWRALLRLRNASRALRTVFVCWLFTFAMVGGEVAWALRPFVGSIYYPVVFLRPDALKGNVYEFIFTDIFPYLLRQK